MSGLVGRPSLANNRSKNVYRNGHFPNRSQHVVNIMHIGIWRNFNLHTSPTFIMTARNMVHNSVKIDSMVNNVMTTLYTIFLTSTILQPQMVPILFNHMIKIFYKFVTIFEIFMILYYSIIWYILLKHYQDGHILSNIVATLFTILQNETYC